MTKHKKIEFIAIAGILMALVTVLSFLKIKTIGLEITLTIVPISVGICYGGKKMGLLLGTYFGILSFIQCLGYSEFGVILLSISALKTFVVCVPTRMISGFLTGLVYDLIKGKMVLSNIASSILMPLFNTILFTSTLILFFYNTEFIQGFVDVLKAKNVIHFAILFVGINGLIELLVGASISFPVSLAVRKYALKK